MTPSSEFIARVNDSTIPDKDRICRTRALAGEMTKSISDRNKASELNRLLNDAYLNLQLAHIADDPAMIDRCRSDCIELVVRVTTEAGRRTAPGVEYA